MKRPFLVRLVPGLFFATLTLTPALAPAQGAPKPGAVEEGKAHFQRGVALFQETDYRAALVEFRRAYELSQNYKVLYNIGQTDIELQDYAGALRAFQTYLDAGGAEIEAARRASVQEDIKKLGARVARVEVKANVEGAEVLVDDVSAGKTPLKEPLLVSIGRRKITLQRGGTVSAPRYVDVAGGDSVSVSLELAEPRAPGPAPGPQPVVVPAPAQGAPVAPPPPARTGLWVSVGVTSALLVGTVITGVLALQAHSDAENQLNSCCMAVKGDIESAHSKTATLALVTDILGATTIAMAGVTIAVGVTSSRTSKPSTAITLGPRGAALSGRF